MKEVNLSRNLIQIRVLEQIKSNLDKIKEYQKHRLVPNKIKEKHKYKDVKES